MKMREIQSAWHMAALINVVIVDSINGTQMSLCSASVSESAIICCGGGGIS